MSGSTNVKWTGTVVIQRSGPIGKHTLDTGPESDLKFGLRTTKSDLQKHFCKI